MKTVRQIIDEIRADIEIRPTPLDEQLDELLKSYEKEIDELMKVIEYSKPHEGLQRTIQKALELPHGEWVPYTTIDGYTTHATCTNCGYERKVSKGCSLDVNELPKFCENCGADMRKKEGARNDRRGNHKKIN